MKEDAVYVQLMKSIKKKIIDGEYHIGDRMESEREMAEKYGINRLTVRNALKKLKEDGYLDAHVGRGTYVKGMPIEKTKINLSEADGLISLSMQIKQTGLKSSREVLSLQKIIVDDEKKEFFKDSEYMYELIRLSMVNDIPYAVQESYFPCSLFKEAERFDFKNGSLYEYMEIWGYIPAKMVSQLKIDYTPVKYQDVLQYGADRKIFSLRYYAYDCNGNQIEYTDSYNLPNYTAYKYITKRE
ncbi:MAG: GntR family transcriptional regulator [Herbinix sp.]|nr:GntR family transcriptional regulator [Herbinix sp.]